MAWKGAWGTFVHIPKCGGFGFRKFLVEHMGDGHEDGPYHGLPPTIDNGFTMVRNPVNWLRSIWAYRNNNNWEYNPKSPNYWPVINGITQWADGLSWDDFVDELIRQDRDIVSVVYGMYQHPDVKLYKLEKAHQLLFDLEIDNKLPVYHVTPNRPTVTAEQRKDLEHLCRRSMRDYGYADELTEVDDSNPLSSIVTMRKRCAELETI